MPQLWNTCRFCHKASFETPNEGMVRYGPRHWCHWSCGLSRWGEEEFLNKLSPFQRDSIPFYLVEASPKLRARLMRLRLKGA